MSLKFLLSLTVFFVLCETKALAQSQLSCVSFTYTFSNNQGVQFINKTGDLTYDSLTLNGEGYFSFLFVSENSDTLFLHNDTLYYYSKQENIRGKVKFRNALSAPPKPLICRAVLWRALKKANEHYELFTDSLRVDDLYFSDSSTWRYVERYSGKSLVDSVEFHVKYIPGSNRKSLEEFQELIFSSRFNDLIQTWQWCFHHYESCVQNVNFDSLHMKLSGVEIKELPDLPLSIQAQTMPVSELSAVDWLQLKERLSKEGVDGRYVLLDFWYLSCAACLLLDEELSRNPLDKDLLMVGVNIRDQQSDIERYVKKKKINRLMLRDDSRFFSGLFNPKAFPTLVLLDLKQDKILRTFIGYPKSLAAELREIIRQGE